MRIDKNFLYYYPIDWTISNRFWSSANAIVVWEQQIK
jgi:hypothetical protein